MADIVKTEAVKNGGVALTTTAAEASQTIAISKDERMCIIVNNGGEDAVSASVTAGSGICSVEGDLEVSVAAGAVEVIGPLESARFGKDGKFTLELSATSSVTVAAIQL